MNDDEFTQALHKYRDEAVSHPLDFRPSIDRLMDSQHCAQINKIFYSSAKWERRKAVATLGPSLPDAKGVYMFVWRPEMIMPFANGTTEQASWVLYVGKAGIEEGASDTLRTRYTSEYKRFVGGDVSSLWNREAASDREARLARYLAMRPMEYWFLLLDSARDVQLLERKLIRMLAPPLNRQLVGPRLRSGTPVPAFEENP